MIIKNCALFTNCISKTNNKKDNAKDIIVMQNMKKNYSNANV